MSHPIATLKKQEIVWLASHRCKHGKFYCEHYNCYREELPHTGEKIGFLDIETEDLRADFGIIFCWCLLDGQTGKIHQDIITPKDIKKYSSKDRNIIPKEDKRIIKSLVECMLKYDRLVLHYGKFDLPFIRTRAVICELTFPTFGTLFQTDTWRILKDKFRLSRNSLENGTRKLVGETRKDHLSLSIKHGCLRGEKWALDASLKHCEKDVLDTRDLHNKIYPFIKLTNKSI